MSDTAFRAWDILVGVVGLLTSIPVLAHGISTQLPSAKLVGLFDTLKDTDSLFESCIEAGLLRQQHIETFRERLTGHAELIRIQVHTARGCGDDFANFVKGLTRKINHVCQEVKEVR
ncbi:hypothetical protein BV20DRAFT_1056741 [Pilatotrama ljubarskyi]|nr:hypothetical protein BV20DRAFT_1056741 [Pilatotrama ljubarskyi]